MATLRQQINEKFLAKLAESADWDDKKIGEFRKLLSADKPPRADDLVRLYQTPTGGEIA